MVNPVALFLSSGFFKPGLDLDTSIYYFLRDDGGLVTLEEIWEEATNIREFSKTAVKKSLESLRKRHMIVEVSELDPRNNVWYYSYKARGV